MIRQVFGAVGLSPWFRYQKYREEFSAPGVTIAVDETPVGTFVELEGSEAGILAAAAALGRTPGDFIVDSYRTLFLRHTAGREAGGDMLFPGPVIPALVLTAGLATRLRPLSLLRAKAAIPVAGRALVSLIVEQLRDAGVTDVVLNLHYLPHTITGQVGDGLHLGVRVRYSWEGVVLGSAGGPRRAAPLLDAATFLVVNGDTLASVDLHQLVAQHRASDALVTMATMPNQEPHKYGGVATAADGA